MTKSKNHQLKMKQKKQLEKEKKEEEYRKFEQRKRFEIRNKIILNTVEEADLLPFNYNRKEFIYEPSILLDEETQRRLYNANSI